MTCITLHHYGRGLAMQDTVAHYIDRIRASFPTLAISTVRLNTDGLANDAVFVNDELVFRFAKTDDARALLSHEIQLLRVVQRYVSLPIPIIEHHSDDFVLYRFIPGKPLYRHAILQRDEHDQQSIAEQLAAFLQEIHSIPLSEFPRPDLHMLPGDSRHTTWLKRLDAIERDIYPLLWADQKDWIAHLFAPVRDGSLNLDAFTPAFIHRDLASYHILHNPKTWRLTGVIDFGTAGAGDPAVDFGCLITMYGESLLRRIHAPYPLAQQTLDRARFQAGALELEWALNGIQTGDTSWLLAHLGRARDVLPIATRW